MTGLETNCFSTWKTGCILFLITAKKTGKQVFVSLNLTTDNMTLPLVEKRVFEELKQHPDKF